MRVRAVGVIGRGLGAAMQGGWRGARRAALLLLAAATAAAAVLAKADASGSQAGGRKLMRIGGDPGARLHCIAPRAAL